MHLQEAWKKRHEEVAEPSKISLLANVEASVLLELMVSIAKHDQHLEASSSRSGVFVITVYIYYCSIYNWMFFLALWFPVM